MCAIWGRPNKAKKQTNKQKPTNLKLEAGPAPNSIRTNRLRERRRYGEKKRRQNLNRKKLRWYSIKVKIQISFHLFNFFSILSLISNYTV